MIAIAGDGLADLLSRAGEGFHRFIRREPLGVVLVLAPWNYPYLSVGQRRGARPPRGERVVLKAASQTPLVAERYAEPRSRRRACPRACSRSCTPTTPTWRG